MENEESVEQQVNLLFTVALLDQASHDLSDEPRLQAFFEQEQEPLVRLAAAIALTTVRGNKVANDVFEYLLHYLACVDEGFDFYSWRLWNKGDLTGIAANALKYAGRGRESIATPILAAAVQRISPGPGFRLAFAFLDLLFKRGPDGRIRTLAELSSTEKAYVDVFIQSDHYRLWMGYDYGLPTNTDDHRRWSNVWSKS